MFIHVAGRLLLSVLIPSLVAQADPQSNQEAPIEPDAVPDAETPHAPSVDYLADQLLEAYRRLECISFEASVLQEGLTADGEFLPLQEAAWAKVRMCGARLRLEVFRCHDGEHLFDYIDDGRTITEITARERLETPVPAPGEGRNLYLSETVGFDGCRVGALLESWLVTASRTNTPAWAAKHIRTGKYLGMEEVDGHACHVVRFRVGTQPGPESILNDFTLYLDAQTFWLRKRVAYQRAFDNSGDILQVVRRTSLYRNISVDRVPEDVFVAPPPPSWGGKSQDQEGHVTTNPSQRSTSGPVEGSPD